jgi:hypothetical protein
MAEQTPRPQAAGTAAAVVKRKAGVPVWRVGKPDAFLAAAVDTARSALAEIARPADVGEHLAAKSEGERVVTHLFESRLPGYRGWQWFVTVARVARSKKATVNEIGLVPSEDAVLAPEWVPWSERVRPEERAAAHADAAGGTDDAEGSAAAAGSPSVTGAAEAGEDAPAGAHAEEATAEEPSEAAPAAEAGPETRED